jgi:hypothetical protein
MCHDIHTKFHEDWFKHSKVDREGIHGQHVDLSSLLLFFFLNKEGKLKNGFTVGVQTLMTKTEDE